MSKQVVATCFICDEVAEADVPSASSKQERSDFIRALRLQGWRYREVGSETKSVCPRHAEKGDW